MPQPSHTTPVTMKDIAARCGVEVNCVSRALRGVPKHMSEATRARILATAKEMGYDPRRTISARRLRAGASTDRIINEAIALCFPPFFTQNAYHRAIYEGIMEVLTPLRFALVIVPTYQPGKVDSEYDFAEHLPSILLRSEVDGVLSSGSVPSMLDRLRIDPGFGNRQIVSMLIATPGYTSVTADDEHGGYLAARHLLDLGHRRIAYMYDAHTESVPHAKRLAGFTRACHELQLEPDTTLIRVTGIRKTNWKERYTQPLISALHTHPDITAILLPNDSFAALFADVLSDLGLRIPDDISLVGCDDIEPLPDAQGQNQLTTIHMPLREIGSQSAERLLAHLHNPETPVKETILPVELVVRGSTAPPRA